MAKTAEFECTVTENTVEDIRFVQACLLRYALPIFKQIVNLDVDQFVLEERLVLRKIGC